MSFQETRFWKLWFIKNHINFGSLALLRLWRSDQDQCLFYWIVSLKYRAVDWVLDGRLQVCNFRKFQVWRLRSIVSISNLLGIFGLSGLENTTSFFSKQNSSNRLNLWMETFWVWRSSEARSIEWNEFEFREITVLVVLFATSQVPGLWQRRRRFF